MTERGQAPDDLRRFCEFGGMAGPVALRIRACMKCLAEYQDSIGSDSGMCQDCWEEYCASKWWELWNQQKGGE